MIGICGLAIGFSSPVEENQGRSDQLDANGSEESATEEIDCFLEAREGAM